MDIPPPLSGPELAPASGGAAKQLIIFMHGVGANGADLLNLGEFMAKDFPDAHFLSPDAPFACDMAPPGYPNSYQWFSLQDRNPVVMEEGAKDVTPIVDAYLETQMKRFNLPANKVALIGFSQGTMTSLHVALHRNEPVAAVVGFSGALLNAAPDEVTAKPPICLIHGDADDVVSYNALGMAEQQLTDIDVSVETHTRPNLGHGIDPEGVEIATKFLKQQMDD